MRRGRTRSRSQPTTQDARSDTLATASSANPTSSIPIGSPRPAPCNQEQGPALKPETEESESSRKERLRARLEKERELAMVPEDPFERLEAEARQRKASMASRMQSKASDVSSKAIQKTTDGEGNHHRQVSETAARAGREGKEGKEPDQNRRQASEHHLEALGPARRRDNVHSDAGRIEERVLQAQRQRVAPEETRSSAGDAPNYEAVLNGKPEAAKKQEDPYKQSRADKQVDGSKTGSRLKGPNELSDMEMDSDEDGDKGKVSSKVAKPDDDDDENDVVVSRVSLK